MQGSVGICNATGKPGHPSQFGCSFMQPSFPLRCLQRQEGPAASRRRTATGVRIHGWHVQSWRGPICGAFPPLNGAVQPEPHYAALTFPR